MWSRNQKKRNLGNHRNLAPKAAALLDLTLFLVTALGFLLGLKIRLFFLLKRLLFRTKVVKKFIVRAIMRRKSGL